MRAKYLAIALASTVLLAPTTPAFAYDKSALIQSYFSVVMIRGYNEKGGLAYGSGVVIGKDKVITNCHVLRSTKQPWVARGEDSYIISSVKVDAWHDLCIVTTEGLPIAPAKFGKSTTLKRGQEVAGIGHSNGVPAPLTSTGSVKGLYNEDGANVIRTNAKFLLGASGSGLFDLDGNLVGINTFKTTGKGGSIHFALPVEWLDELDKQTATTVFPISGKALWEEDEDKKPFYMQAAVPESRYDWPKLAQVAEKWTAAEPKSTEAWYALGLGLENSGKTEAAGTAYKQAITVDANNFEAMTRLGALAKERGDKDEMHRIQLAIDGIDEQAALDYSNLLGCDKAC
jgi:serine protease Do